jgi:aminopeptidase YwaD
MASPRLSLLVLFALQIACKGAPPEPPVAPAPAPANQPQPVDPWQSPPAIATATLQAHLAFLADDAQEGRPPGTAADLRVQDHIQAEMQRIGLLPAFPAGYRQPFTITDGVRPRDGAPSQLRVGGRDLAHAMLPFGHDTFTAGPIEAPLIFVGHGLTADGPGTGDYTGLSERVRGAIVVVLLGAPDDPHRTPASTRPQTKVITARDHGALGVVLVDPEGDLPFHNHGQVSDLQIPVVALTKSQTPPLFAALGARRGLPRPGARSAGKARLATPFTPVVLATANLGGVLPGAGGGRSIVLGAHMDHLGHGTSSSLAPGERAIHNGADDNASGVAVVLALAAAFASIPKESRPFDLIFYAFGAEEMGLLGSKHLVEQLSPEQRAQHLAMLNFDMVGRLRDDALIVAGAGTAQEWPDLLARSAGSLQIRPSDDGYGASDQTSFYEVGIPVLHFFTGPHDDYHRPSDDIERINVDGAARVAEVALRLVGHIMRDRSDLKHIRVAKEAPARSGGFRVSLGTVPDYAAQVDGVKLSGVREGGPAELAGLRAGDIIQRLGDREIHNLDDYMAAFAALKPGVEIPVVIERESAQITLKLTPTAPRSR